MEESIHMTVFTKMGENKRLEKNITKKGTGGKNMQHSLEVERAGAYGLDFFIEHALYLPGVMKWKVT